MIAITKSSYLTSIPEQTKLYVNTAHTYTKTLKIILSRCHTLYSSLVNRSITVVTTYSLHIFLIIFVCLTIAITLKLNRTNKNICSIYTQTTTPAHDLFYDELQNISKSYEDKIRTDTDILRTLSNKISEYNNTNTALISEIIETKLRHDKQIQEQKEMYTAYISAIPQLTEKLSNIYAQSNQAWVDLANTYSKKLKLQIDENTELNNSLIVEYNARASALASVAKANIIKRNKYFDIQKKYALALQKTDRLMETINALKSDHDSVTHLLEASTQTDSKLQVLLEVSETITIEAKSSLSYTTEQQQDFHYFTNTDSD